MRYFVSLGDETTQVDVEELATGEYRVKHSGAEHVVRIEGENVLIGDRVIPCQTDARRGVVDVRHASLPFIVSRENPETASSAAASHRPELRAPMPGKVVDVRVAAGGHLRHVKFERETAAVFHLAATTIDVGRAGVYDSRALTFGGRIVRNDIVARLSGEGAECTLDGLYVSDGETLVDTHTTIDHAQAHCPSHEVYKGILAGSAQAVFNGKIIVRPGAQKTDAKQTNKALLLSDGARINTKPQLEIFADDVKCTHGAAIGQLDEDALFYLRARGIAGLDARNLLIHAFAGEVIDEVTIPAVRDAALHAMEAKLSLTELTGTLG